MSSFMMRFPFKIIDLTHTLDETAPSWNGGCGFQSEIKCDYSDSTTDIKFRVQKLTLYAGIGTHIDAPAHCIPHGHTIDHLSLTHLIAPCVVIDVSGQAHDLYSLSSCEIDTFEKKHGSIEPGSFVLIRTGWDQYWSDAERYRNKHVFPSVSQEAAQAFVKRQIVGLGIDTLSPDRPQDGYGVHDVLLKAGKYIIENVANSDLLPPVGSFSVALPLKIKGGTESPLRFIAFLPQNPT
jgi:kynurenine formamidase